MIPQDAGFPEPAKKAPTSRRETKAVAGRIDPSPRGPAGQPQQAMTPAGLSSSPDLGTYLQALKRRWISAAALGGTLAVLAALAAWFLLSPKYIAFGRVRVAFDVPTPLDKIPGGRGDFKTYLKTQAGHLSGRPVISEALKRDEIKALNLEARTGKEPAQYIDEELKVEAPDDQELVTVLMSSPDPQVSLAIVKAVIASYLDVIVYAEKEERLHRVADMNKLLDKASAALKQKQDRLNTMIGEAGDLDPALLAIKIHELTAGIRESNSQRSSLRLEIRKAQADLASHKERIKALKDAAVSESHVEAALKNDPLAQKLKADIHHAQEVIDDFEQKSPGVPYVSLTSNKNRIRMAQAKLKKRKKELQEELEAAVEASGDGGKEELELVRVTKANAIQAMEEHLEYLGKNLIDLNKELTKLKRVDHAEQDQLRKTILQEEEFVNKLTLELRKEEVNLQYSQRVTLAQDAELQKKDMKKQILGVALSPVVALLGVCMSVAWLDVRQRRIRSAGEVSRGLGIRVVGAVPTVPNLEHHLVGPTGEPDLEGHPALESIDALRTQLLRDADDVHTRLVMVTSATHGEGKTTVASHLASSLARAGRKTLLIDGDLRRPSAHQLFELPMQPGFSEVLLSEVELTDAVQPTTLDGLSFMAAGQWDREVLHALARDGVEGIFEKLQQEFDFIVIDSHPVLPATDSLLIGQRVDAAILSVLREVSQMPRVYAASQRLTTLGIRVLGAVVNGADPEEALAATAHARMVAH
ncbi:MAG TPA: polysaccharide biosynthesis tyrosine autokinase [Gemmataceae bacterium]|nr:polysaccharide biosynthesis tyrosine autokinase [Gemmataceae bacterium]